MVPPKVLDHQVKKGPEHGPTASEAISESAIEGPKQWAFFSIL